MKPLFNESNDRFTLTAKVSPDKMKIFIEGKPSGKSPVTAKELNEIITRHVPERMLHDRVVDEMAEMLSRGEAVSERRIAKGEEPGIGQDGKQVLMVKAYTEKPEMTEDKRGFTELHELHLFDNVSVGQVLARIYPPHIGKDGHDAFGVKVAAKMGKPLKANYDKKTIEIKPGEGFETLNAKVAGYLKVEGGALQMVEELVVSGNVDFHVGNVDFVGAVTIKGDVMQGFTVRAVKGITVTGSVHKASLICTAGGIDCRGSISGGEKSRIVSANFLKAKVLHEASVEVATDLVLEKEARDSKLLIEGALYGDNGVLLGGETRTAKGIQVKQLGYESGTETMVTLCSTIETRGEYTVLLDQISAHEKALNMLELHLGPLAKTPSRVQLLKEPHRGKMEKLLEKLSSVSKSLDSLRGKKMKLLESSQQVEGLRVNIMQKAFPGVKLVAGKDTFEVKEEMAGPKTLIYDAQKKEFRWQDFLALEERKEPEKEKKK